MIKKKNRALNEYQRALQTNDNTQGALDEANEHIQKPYKGDTRQVGERRVELRSGGRVDALFGAPGLWGGQPSRFSALHPDVQARFFFSSGRRHTSSLRDWSSDVCSSD